MTPSSPSLLRCLRSLFPIRGGLTYEEALRIAELQATRLVELLGSDQLTEATFAWQPRLHVVREPLAVSGMSHWTGTEWLVTLNEADSLPRQRFTLLHEFKHIVDHGHTKQLYTGSLRATAAEQAERAADYFAGCALVPKRELKAAWGRGMQHLDDLANHFGVSVNAVAVRLAQTKLNLAADRPAAARCARPVASPRSGPQHFRVTRPRRSLV
jgi:predicted transcriptional regulator